MVPQFVNFVICAAAAFGVVVASTGAAGEELYRETMRDGVQFVVARKALNDPAILRGFMYKPALAHFEKIYSIVVELALPDRSSISLASRVQVQTGADDGGFHVLRAVQRPNAIVVLFTEGYSIGLWRVRIAGPRPTEIAWLGGWHASALARPIDAGFVAVDLREIPGGRWRVRITDNAVSPPATTTLEQDGADWRFVVTGGYKWHRFELASGATRPATPEAAGLGRQLDFIQMNVFSDNGWWLKLRDDGGGTVGYGEADPFGYVFPPGTCDYAGLLARLAPREPRTADSGFYVAFLDAYGSTAAGHPLGEPSMVKSLFETAYGAGRGRSQYSPEIEDAWAKSPPVGRTGP